MGPYGAIWGYVGLYGAIWGYMGLYGAFIGLIYDPPGIFIFPTRLLVTDVST